MVVSKNTRELLILPQYRVTGYKRLCKVIPAKYAVDLESSIHKFCKTYSDKKDVEKSYRNKVYNTKLSSICYDLDQINCPSLIIRIMNGSLNVKDIPDMNYTEINPERWSVIIKRIEYTEDKRNNMATSTDHKCRKCGCEESYGYVIQTRSCDEPATVFVICKRCSHRFRM
jgi:DNA-directed RNA polymerase subunit M/transcription elongation factor TFIIS